MISVKRCIKNFDQKFIYKDNYALTKGREEKNI